MSIYSWATVVCSKGDVFHQRSLWKFQKHAVLSEEVC